MGAGEGEEERRDWFGDGRKLPRAFNSLHACSQALASREEMYTFAPFATKPSEIIRPIPLAPPVTRTTLPCVNISGCLRGCIVVLVVYLDVEKTCGIHDWSGL